jgi:hypothetical protein
MTFASHLP